MANNVNDLKPAPAPEPTPAQEPTPTPAPAPDPTPAPAPAPATEPAHDADYYAKIIEAQQKQLDQQGKRIDQLLTQLNTAINNGGNYQEPASKVNTNPANPQPASELAKDYSEMDFTI